MKNSTYLAITGAALLGFSGVAQAASMSYQMDQTNSDILADGFDYLTVTISDNGPDIDFSVVVNTSEFPTPGANFGLQSFYFNYDPTLTVDSSNITNIMPSTWDISTDRGAGGGFGFFEFKLAGTGQTRTETLTFTISGIDGDTIEDYAIGYEGIGEAYFAAHVAGWGDNGEYSAKFATVVPVPAAVWLFGTGLIGLAGIARRKRA